MEDAQAQIADLTGKGSEYAELGIEFAIEHGPTLLLAIATLVIGLWIINRVVGFMGRTMEARKVEVTLAKFLGSLANVGLKALLLISVAGMVGIETTSFIAVLGAAGLAVGLALQGSLSNFAGGALILLFKPYRVGNVIDAQGFLGTVHEIGILNTVLKTFDNRTIIIPNGAIANGPITNNSLEATRRVDWTFGVGYDDDVRKVNALLMELVKQDERVHAEPGPVVKLHEFGDSSVNFVVRAWTDAGNFFPVFWDMNERVKLAFDEQGVSIPFPQTDVHLHRVEG